MARRSTLKDKRSSKELEDLLDGLEKLIERTKVMYEQYFMGIQKVAPMQLHRDIERRIRELTQEQIRNTGLRFRFTTLSQKFGSYNTYWKRTMRKIEQGTYVRDVQRATRQAQRAGKDIPDELLLKLPKRVRERIIRDRERLAKREGRKQGKGAEPPAESASARKARAPGADANGAFNISDDFSLEDGEFDNLFAALTGAEEEKTAPRATPPTPPSSLGDYDDQTINGPPPVPTPDSSQLFAAGSEPKVAKPAARGNSRPGPGNGKRPVPRKAPRDTVLDPPGRRPTATARGTARGSGKDTLPPGMSERQSRELYKRYVKAREIVGDNKPVSYDKLMSTLNRQAPKIMNEHKASGVDFNVVIKGNKVVVKAKPIK